MTILQRIAAGDRGAPDECLARYGAVVWTLARRTLRRREDAEDAVQEVFIELWRVAGRYNPAAASEQAFVTAIARRRIVDRLRRLSRLGPIEPLEGNEPVGAAASTPGPELTEEVRQAREGLLTLKPDERHVLELSIDRGLSHGQIAEATGLSLGTVKSHARRGLRRLREMLIRDPAPGRTAARTQEQTR